MQAQTEYTIKTLNNISRTGLDLLTDRFHLVDDAADPDAILVRSADLHNMPLTDNIRFIGRAGAGTNNIPIDRCSEAGIVVANAPGANANGVKELVLTGMLLTSRDILGAIKWVEGLDTSSDVCKTVEAGKKQFVGPEIAGKTLGVIGLGATGQKIAGMGVDLGMTVVGYDPFLSVNSALHLDSRVHYVEDIKDIFKHCDYISLHIPLTATTKNLVNKELLDLAKENLVLLNIARGGLVDLPALKEALAARRIKNYVVDFPDQETLSLPYTINMPHIGASTPESEENSAKMIVEEMMEYLALGNIRNSVNFPNCSMGPINSIHRITVLHKNIPSMVAQITTILAEENMNISDLLNRHKNGWAYTMVDLDSHVNERLRDRLNAIEGVVRVRLIR